MTMLANQPDKAPTINQASQPITFASMIKAPFSASTLLAEFPTYAYKSK
jgi:hypothetical protein